MTISSIELSIPTVLKELLSRELDKSKIVSYQNKYAVAILEQIGKQPIGTFNIEATLMDFLADYIKRWYDYYLVQGDYGYINSLKEYKTSEEHLDLDISQFIPKLTIAKLFLYAGILYSYTEIQPLKHTDRTAVYKLYAALCAKFPLKKIVALEHVGFYGDPLIDVAIDYMKYQHNRCIQRPSKDTKIFYSHVNKNHSTLIAGSIVNSVTLYLQRLFYKGRLSHNQNTHHRLAKFLMRFPYTEDLFAADLDSAEILNFTNIYNHAQLFFYGSCEESVNLKYFNDIKEHAKNIFKKSPFKNAMLCVALLTDNQKGNYNAYCNTEVFSERLLTLVIDFICKSTDKEAVKKVLLQIKQDFDVLTTARFGKRLTLAIIENNIKDFSLLELIYDLRLGLRDVAYLNNKIKLFAKRYNTQYFKKIGIDDYFMLSASEMNRIWGFIGGRCDRYKKLLICNSFLPEEVNLDIDDLKGIQRYIRLIRDISWGTAFDDVAVDSVASVLTVGNVKVVIRNLLDNIKASNLDVIRINIMSTLKTSSLCKPFAIDASIISLGSDNWIFHDPALPQEYIRFNRAETNSVVQYIYISCKNALDTLVNKILANEAASLRADRSIKRLSFEYGFVMSTFSCIVKPDLLRRGETPSDLSENTVVMHTLDSLPRSHSDNNLRARNSFEFRPI